MELENIFFNSKAFFFSLSHPSVFFNSISIFFGNNIDHLLLFSVCGQPFVHSSLNPRNIFIKKIVLDHVLLMVMWPHLLMIMVWPDLSMMVVWRNYPLRSKLIHGSFSYFVNRSVTDLSIYFIFLTNSRVKFLWL